MVSRTSDTTVAALRFSNAPDLEQHADFPVSAADASSPGHPGQPLSLVMWAYADPRDVVDAHVTSHAVVRWPLIHNRSSSSERRWLVFADPGAGGG